jgi:hypothetical protein
MQVRPIVERRISVLARMDYCAHGLVGALQASGLKQNAIGDWLQLKLHRQAAAVVE